MNQALQIHPKDNVAVALRDLSRGETVQVGGDRLKLTEDIPRGHKFALSGIETERNVVKYGFPIGRATQKIIRGSWVHSHNLRTDLDAASERYAYRGGCSESPAEDRGMTFEGFRRADGSAGIRNELWVIPTVGCINETCVQIAHRFQQRTNGIAAGNVVVLRHNFGCSQLGDDLADTRRVLADFVRHPNAGGVLVVSLGCENNTMPEFIRELGEFDRGRVRFLKAQEEKDEVEAGAKLLGELNSHMAGDRRESIPLSELRVGLKCGGSDGFSGITANPMIGGLTDFLTGQGGTAVLTEVPEMFGAETILMDRARDEAVFRGTVNLILRFKDYFTANHQPVYENPSPGNKAGGITTLEEKSLGCTQKAGSAAVEDVLDYGGRIRRKGLNLLCSPGNDLVSCSALAAAGCQMILFSTGRGTPFGSLVPTVKISSNTQLYNTKPHWIDFDAGRRLAGAEKAELLEELVRLVLDTASGRPTRNEENGFREFAIWKNGVTL